MRISSIATMGFNYSLSVFWYAGFKVKIGDPLNGWKAEGEFAGSARPVDWLVQQAGIDFPPSQPDD